MVEYLHQEGRDGVEVVEEGSPLTATASKKMSEFLCMVCISFATLQAVLNLISCGFSSPF